MRIVCPSCAAEYDVPIARLKPGKLVRCGRCGSDWLPDPEAEAIVPPKDAAAPPQPQLQAEAETIAPLQGVTAMDRLAASPAPLPRRTALIGAWVLTVIVLAATAAAAIAWPAALIRAWPPSSRILPAIGHITPQPEPTVVKKPE